MTPDQEPLTDAELVARLRALYTASDHSGGARDDFWDCISFHIGWVLDLAERGAKRRKDNPGARRAAGLKRAASLSPERRSEIAKQSAEARWHRHHQQQEESK